MSFDINYNMYSYKPIQNTQVSYQQKDKSKETPKSTDVVSENSTKIQKFQYFI